MRAFFVLVIALGSLAVNAQEVSFRLFLIGDGGEPTVAQVGYQRLLQETIESGPRQQAAILLGDNIYPKGMPLPGHAARAESEKILSDQLGLVQALNGRPVYIIPGNHDWKQGRREGFDYLLEQQAWLDSLHRTDINWLPRNGCPGPVEVHLTDNLVLIAIDTQWFLHGWEKPEGDNSLCEVKTPGDFLAQLEDILKRNRGKRVVVAGHHPVITYGEHGGQFRPKDHLFPLTSFSRNLYLPLPVGGSLYPYYRKIFGNIQDLAHPLYKQLATSLHDVFQRFPETIYVSGHEHNLQYSVRDQVHYVVSGAGSKSSHARKKGYARFVASQIGFASLTFYRDGSARLEFVSGDSVLYSQPLPVVAPLVATQMDDVRLADSVRVVASDRYQATPMHERWLGRNYRAAWSQPIEVPVFDLGRERGGLKIVQRGGGMQTLSLRLEDSTGREFTLRSIDKFPEKAVPEPFRKTFAEDLVQDQISASHPYAALVVPKLAEAARIYHSNPRVVQLPDDPRLGIYREVFANQVMLFEERPSGSSRNLPFFGDGGKIISTEKLLELLKKDNDFYVDQDFVLRSRLFDLWIGDWDRHDDQWRWVEFDRKKTTYYRPIPRDRDQAFFVNEGRIPKIWSRRWALPKFQGFDRELRWPSEFMFNARYFDRSFLSGLPKEEWIQESERLVARLTDSVVDSALREWPEEIYKIRGAEIREKLLARRQLLPQLALSHYQFLAREVDWVGSDKRELVLARFLADGKLSVEMFKLTKAGDVERKMYSRVFFPGETREVRVYGLGGDDRFELDGGEKSPIKLRLIAGDGLDSVTNRSAGKPFIYDLKDNIVINGDVRDRTSHHSEVNHYDRKTFKYDRLAPLVYGNFNPDDGLFLGGGFLWVKHGFRKDPFKSKHLLLGSYALRTNSFNLKYDGRFKQLMGKWDLELDVDIKSPNYVNNFFGWGNESVFNQNIESSLGIPLARPVDYYRLRFKEYLGSVHLARYFSGGGFLKVGSVFQHVELEDPENPRYIEEYDATLPESILEKGKDFAGLSWEWGYEKLNHPTLTTRGISFRQWSRSLTGLGGQNFETVTFHNTSLAFYQTFKFPARVTFAFRASGGINTGNYEIYQAQILDGKTEIRGFRKTRFYGDRKLVFNQEVRIKLATFRSYLFPASFGIHGFYDVGRVWYKDDQGIDPTVPGGRSKLWHKGYGGGLWFTPFNLTVLTTEVATSVEETLFYIRLGFLF